jgi:phage shock protein A
MAESLEDEHERLLREVAALEREHEGLTAHPKDIDGHKAHIVKLRAQIAALHEHIRRIKKEMH